jgi:phytoene/squalene synthetase
MLSASYYREQARLLLQWANDAREPEVARRLTRRAQDMLALAQDTVPGEPVTDAIEYFNTQQMMARPRRKEGPR